MGGPRQVDRLPDRGLSAFVIGLDTDQTAAIAWSSGTYDLEAIRPDGAVVAVIGPSRVVIAPEVTVWA